VHSAIHKKNQNKLGELFDELFAVPRESIPEPRQRDIDNGRRLYLPRRQLLFQILRQINQVNHQTLCIRLLNTCMYDVYTHTGEPVD